MKLSIYTICVAALLAASTSPALAGDASWNGTWKLDRAKSQMTGDTFTYSMNANGTIRYSNGGTFTYDFACDGKDYNAGVTGYTIACKKVSDMTYDFTNKQNGTVRSTDQVVISTSGKTMTDTAKGTRPDGTTYTSVDTYDRASGTSGLVGEWKHVNATGAAGLMTISVTETTLTQSNPAYKTSVTAKLDGSDASLSGPTIPPGVTVSFKPQGSRQIYSVTKLNGKVVGEDTMTLSADGTTITDVSSTPGQSAKQTYVYVKQ